MAGSKWGFLTLLSCVGRLYFLESILLSCEQSPCDRLSGQLNIPGLGLYTDHTCGPTLCLEWVHSKSDTSMLSFSLSRQQNQGHRICKLWI